MSWVPAVGGIIGAFLGGLATDLLAKYGRPHYRLWVLALSQVCYICILYLYNGSLYCPQDKEHGSLANTS